MEMPGTDTCQLTDTTDPRSHLTDKGTEAKKGWITSPSSQWLVNNRSKSLCQISSSKRRVKGEQGKYYVSSECDTHPKE